MRVIENPILPGFHPDPSFLRVGSDYYLATSTFEWYPGVRIYHSTNLGAWRLVATPLNRPALLDMRGNPDSGGVWAPCLSYADGLFWLIYTDVKRLDGAFKDTHNYITTCPRIDGEWSDPIYVNSSGFDPSLFHDDDGRKWLLNMVWNHGRPDTGSNPTHHRFDGIALQEWDPDKGLFGPIKNIWSGSQRGLTEAPHIFKRNGYYYLTTAEGGTGYGHAVSMARARHLEGPYEAHPEQHLMTHSDTPDHAFQRIGHGQYVETQDGFAYHSFLMGRPIPGPDGVGRFCPLGRETGLERCVWKADNWLYLEESGQTVRAKLTCADQGQHSVQKAKTKTINYTFSHLHSDFQWLRTPFPERLFRLENNRLILIGRESIGSCFEQTLLARRQQHLIYSAECQLEFTPQTYQQAAGLITYYNGHKFHAVMLSYDQKLGRILTMFSCPGRYPNTDMDYPLAEPVPVAEGRVELRVQTDHAKQQFFWKQGEDWHPVGPVLNAACLSDEAGKGEGKSFTGNFVGMIAFDTSGLAAEAQFSRFSYTGAE